MKQTPMFTMIMFKNMKQILFLILFPTILSAQFKQTLQPMTPSFVLETKEQRTGKVLEFIAYPLFAGSGFCAGLSNKFRKIDSPNSNRPEIYAIAASAGFVGSAGMWGVGISMQGKPKWTDLYKFIGGIGFSTIGYYTGYQVAEIFNPK